MQQRDGIYNQFTAIDDKGRATTTSLLSSTHAMACFSWSIPAGHSCPSAVFGAGKICESCYAMINRYAHDPVANAQWRRFQWTKHLLKTDPARWVQTMADNIAKTATSGKHARPFFRWHDSGDLFSLRYIEAVTAVCRATPDVDHWIPTRGWQAGPDQQPIATDSKWHKALLALSKLPNVVVRSSALAFNSPAPTTPYGPGSSAYLADVEVRNGTVTLGGIEHKACPKSTTDDGTCESVGCRSCWESDSGPVAYFVHGWQGRHTPSTLSAASQAKRAARRDKFVKITVAGVA